MRTPRSTWSLRRRPSKSAHRASAARKSTRIPTTRVSRTTRSRRYGPRKRRPLLYEDDSGWQEDPEPLDDKTKAALENLDDKTKAALDNPGVFGAADIAINLLLYVRPLQLPQVCALNRFFAAVCKQAKFRQLYEDAWFIHVRFVGPGAQRVDKRFFRWRTVGDAIGALANTLVLPQTMINLNLEFQGKVARRGSSLIGMARYQAAHAPLTSKKDAGIDLKVRWRSSQNDTPGQISRRWFTDGTFLDVSHSQPVSRPTDFP